MRQLTQQRLLHLWSPPPVADRTDDNTSSVRVRVYTIHMGGIMAWPESQGKTLGKGVNRGHTVYSQNSICSELDTMMV